jgi:hypothetical protein
MQQIPFAAGVDDGLVRGAEDPQGAVDLAQFLERVVRVVGGLMRND